MLIYLDNCCYNRPYDNMENKIVLREAQAKLKVQEMIKNHEIELVISFMLKYENSINPYAIRKDSIEEFMDEYGSVYVSVSDENKIHETICDIMKTGIRYNDACHVACAIRAGADFFLTTDKRLLKYKTNKVKMMNPIDFIIDFQKED